MEEEYNKKVKKKKKSFTLFIIHFGHWDVSLLLSIVKLKFYKSNVSHIPFETNNKIWEVHK